MVTPKSGIPEIETLEIETPEAASTTSPSAVPTVTPAVAPTPEPTPNPSGDPLNSPHPIPWNWVVEQQAASEASPTLQMQYYRSPSLVSPDGDYAVYSRIQLELLPETPQDRVSSILFMENLETGDLRFVTASSPHVRNPWIPEEEYGQPGMIAILMPVAWSEGGDRLLVRAFESIFGTDLASDYAVLWDRQQDQLQTLAPTNLVYSNAILLGWSRENTDQVLFRAGNLGDEQWPMLAVDPTGETMLATEGDEPVIFGQATESFWNGPQAIR
ncbi:MAG: hypothetical protein VKK04_03405 [Synechococcales bacterium]|nr:hypothetical protein [Synechococcales bacterium]